MAWIYLLGEPTHLLRFVFLGFMIVGDRGSKISI